LEETWCKTDYRMNDYHDLTHQLMEATGWDVVGGLLRMEGRLLASRDLVVRV
jgi:hypothetical protein